MATNSLVFDFLAKDRASSTFDKLSAKSDGLGSKLRAFGGFAAHALGIAATAAAGLGSAGILMGVRTAAGLEQAQIAFETLLGSGEAAESFLSDLKTFAASTPFELPGLIDAARQLIGVGQSAESVIPTLTAWGDTAGALGISQEQFSRAMIAVTQAMSKGKVQAEELMQITEAGIPIYPLLARAMGKTVPELQEMSSKGELLASEVFPALEAQMNKDYGGAMARQSKTLTGLWSTFMDTLNLGLAGAILPVQDQLKGGLTKAIEIAGAALAALPGIVEDAASGLGRFKDFVTNTVAPNAITAFTSIKTGVTTLFSNLFGDVDFVALGQTLLERAVTLATDLIEGLRVGVTEGDWGPLGTTIGEAVGNALITAAGLTEKFLAWFGSVDWVGLAIEVGAMAIPFVVGFVTGLINSLSDPAMWMELASHWEEILLAALGVALMPAKWIAAIAKLLAKIPFVGKFVSWFFTGFANISKAVLDRGLKFLGDFFGAMGKGILGPGGVGTITKFVTWLKNFPTAIGVAAIDLAEAAGRMMGRLRDGIIGWAGRIGGAIGNIVSSITSPFRSAGSWLVSKGGEIIGGLRSGLTDRFTSVRQWLYDLPGRIRDVFKNAGRWLVNIGRQVLGGLWDGMKDKWNDITGWLSSLNPGNWFNDINVQKGHAEKNLLPMGEAVFRGLRKGMETGWTDVARWLKTVDPSAAMSPMGGGVMVAGGAGGPPLELHVHFDGPVGSPAELKNWLTRALDDLRREGRL